MGRYAARYGSPATAWRRLKRWSEEGVWEEVMKALRDAAYQKGKFSMDVVCVDSSFIETKKGRKFRIQRPQKRNGIKIHGCVSCEGFPLTIQIASGKEHDRNHFVEVMENIEIKTNRRPRTRPSEVLADHTYDEITIRKYLRRRAIKSNIPINIRNRKYPKRGRPTRLEYESHKKRGEIASRYERLNVVFKGLIKIACFCCVGKSFKRCFEIGSLSNGFS